MARKNRGPSQVVELLTSLSARLGIESDRDLAALAGVGVETVANWRGGNVRELKPQKLAAVISGLCARIESLQERAGMLAIDPALGLVPIEVEEHSSPVELQRQLRARIHYDYLGHRFLYFEPQGALAWENLIRAGYEQDTWLRGVDRCAQAWFDTSRHARGGCKGPIATALGLGRKTRARGLDMISLGPGEGGKEVRVLGRLLDLEQREGRTLPSCTLALCDVSIALLLRAAMDTRRRVLAAGSHANVLPFCADFEEGPLSFLARLPTARAPQEEGLRLVLILGNVFGNLRDEATFVRQKLHGLLRPGDLLWLEVGIRPDHIEADPLFTLTLAGREETAGEANRRLLLEGPYRRWESARGRQPGRIEMRVWMREDDESSRVPGSYNFCHDLVLGDEDRTLTMLYSRRYQVEGLTRWLEEQGFAIERIVQVADSKRRPRVAHVLARRLE